MVMLKREIAPWSDWDNEGRLGNATLACVPAAWDYYVVFAQRQGLQRVL